MGKTKWGGVPLPKDAEVRCIACGNPLYFFPDCYPLAFHCEDGHFQTVRDLLDELLPLRKAPQPTALEHWRRKSLLLEELAGRALTGGHALAAADLLETADRITCWVHSLRKLLDPHRAHPAAGREAPTAPARSGIPVQ